MILTHYEWDCPRCGQPAVISFDGLYEIRCAACHVAEFGETLEKAIRCFEHPAEEVCNG